MARHLLTEDEKLELSGYEYPFENVAFEGGGNKGNAYIGAIRVLEEVGIWKNIRRIAGASIGAISAAWAAVGYSSYEIEELCNRDLKYICHDGRWFGLMNLYRHYGWHPGSRLYAWLGKTFEEKTGNPDITFYELYRTQGRELCITTTNLNQLDCVYCHVKTTPELPIRMAIRMSLSIPGVFSAVKYKMYTNPEVFVDGGLLCNYPLHVFDGWYLSMKPKDNYLKRIPRSKDCAQVWDVKERFGKRNDKTLGMLLYSDEEQELFKVDLEKREQKYVKNWTPFPDTFLTRKRKTLIERRKKAAETRDELTEAMEAFMMACSKCDFDDSGTISKAELKEVLKEENSHFTKGQAELLFGTGYEIDELFDRLDLDESGDISFNELIQFGEQQGITLMSSYRGFNSRDIKTVGDFFNAIMDSMLINIKRLVVQGDDLDRTVGINTKYLDTLDFDLESADKKFLLEQGKVGCIAFLRHYIETKKPPRKSKSANTHPRPRGNKSASSEESAIQLDQDDSDLETISEEGPEQDHKADINLEDSQTMESSTGKPYKQTETSFVETNGEVFVDPNGKAFVEPKGEALVEPNGEALVEPNGEALVEPNGEALVEPDGEAFVQSNGDAALVEPRGETALIEPNGEVLIKADGETSTATAVTSDTM